MRAAKTSAGTGRRYAATAMLLCLLGAGGLLQASLHLIFGVLLWIIVVLRFEGGSLEEHAARDADLAACSRRLSREVYLLLYGLCGANQLLRLPPENTRDYLLFGVAALVLTRLLAWKRLNALSQRFPATNTTNVSAIGNGRG